MHCKYWRIAGSTHSKMQMIRLWEVLQQHYHCLKINRIQVLGLDERKHGKVTIQSVMPTLLALLNFHHDSRTFNRSASSAFICRDNTRKKIENGKYSTTTLYSATNALLADTLRKSHNVENAVELIVVVWIACLDVFLSTVKYRLRCQQLSKDTSNRPDI